MLPKSELCPVCNREICECGDEAAEYYMRRETEGLQDWDNEEIREIERDS